MKNISNFKSLKIGSSKLLIINGGLEPRPTTVLGAGESDTWNDNNNNGVIDSGDTITIHSCEDEE